MAQLTESTGISEEVSVADADESDLESPVNYDEAGLVEVELGDTQYRLDSGKQGTALCISSRAPGTWRWRFHGEARWDGRTLRTKAFDRQLLDQLSREVQRAAAGD